MLKGNYREFYDELAEFISADRLYTDDLRTLTYGTDGGFYRLIPKLVVKADNENEIIKIITTANRLKIPLTFKAAGTSLSGQTITDSVLVMLSQNWRDYRVLNNGDKIYMQPGVVAGYANLALGPHNKKLGPDPASINSAMIAGIAANNASGMTSGTVQNIYNTLADMRIVFNDGTVLDTRNKESVEEFLAVKEDFVQGIKELAEKVKSNEKLSARIRQKYGMKNTTGYGLNSLIDFDDPVDIIKHLIIGSEGTLGFISDITLNTVDSLPFKASALMLFEDIKAAADAVPVLSSLPVDASEIMDRAALRAVEDIPGLPAHLKTLNEEAAALLVETSAENGESLQKNIDEITSGMEGMRLAHPVSFTTNKKEQKTLWDVRKGLFPTVCKSRLPGTSVIIEDVNFSVADLANAVLDLQSLFKEYGYDSIIWGHSLSGNLHFVFTPEFGSDTELEKYRKFMDALVKLVVDKYDGSLKAEHGTGRNMAPFVEYEWGSEAYSVMKEIKRLFDPGYIFNPGVLLNDDPQVHLKNLRPLPVADETIDKCIECGFCEVNCPSKDVTLTPRQRIVAWREISRLNATGENEARKNELLHEYRYYGDETCATDGLCELACPVDIDTGKLIKKLRAENVGSFANKTADVISRNMKTVTSIGKTGLDVVNIAHSTLGESVMEGVSKGLRSLTGGKAPLWNKYMPKGADQLKPQTVTENNPNKVVYFPSCINRTMGTAKGDGETESLTSVAYSLLAKAGFDIIYPENINGLCCGMPYSSKGLKKQGNAKAEELRQALWAASENGKYPILFDMSPCLYTMQQYLEESDETGNRMKIYEPIEFTLEYLADKLEFEKLNDTVSIHTTCSSAKMGLDDKFRQLTEMCVENVVAPAEVKCCGWAGDRGFTHPELNAAALNRLDKLLPDEVDEGFSTSRTCEIGLSLHSGRPYKSILYLVDRVTKAKV